MIGARASLGTRCGRQTPGAFGKPAHQQPTERPTWEYVSPDGNTKIVYHDGKGD